MRIRLPQPHPSPRPREELFSEYWTIFRCWNSNLKSESKQMNHRIGLSGHTLEGFSPTADSRDQTVKARTTSLDPFPVLLLRPTTQYHYSAPLPSPTPQTHHPVQHLRPTTKPTTQFNTLVRPHTHVPTHSHSPIHPRAHETETKYYHYWRRVPKLLVIVNHVKSPD